MEKKGMIGLIVLGMLLFGGNLESVISQVSKPAVDPIPLPRPADPGMKTVDPVMKPAVISKNPLIKALPDLVVEDITLTPDCLVAVRVANLGRGMVPDTVWTVQTPQSSSVYIHVDGNPWGGETIWHLDPGKALQPSGGRAVFKSNYRVQGTKTIKATIDHTAQVAESNEGNNMKTESLTCRGSGQPPPAPGPDPDRRPVHKDLTVRISNCPQSVVPGQNLANAFQVTAVNTAPASSVNDIFVDLVLRSDPNCPSPASLANYSPNFSNGVLLQGGRTNISLAAGETKPVTTLGGVIPADTPPGTYFLCAVIDSGNKVKEENESNNCACCRIQVGPRPTTGAAPDATPIQLPAVR